MSVSAGVLDHFNIRNPQARRPRSGSTRIILGPGEGRPAELCLSPGHGCTARASRWCILVRYFPDQRAAKAGFRRSVHSRRLRQPGFFAGMKQRFGVQREWNSTSRQVPGGDLWQIFVDDPNGVMIELNYEAAQGAGRKRQRPSSAWMTLGAGSLLRGTALWVAIRT